MKSFDFFSRHLDDYLRELQGLTEIEAPTGDLENLDRAAAFIAELFEPLGDLESENLEDHGRLLRVDRPGTGARILLLGHYDTVWPPGSWSSPWRSDEVPRRLALLAELVISLARLEPVAPEPELSSAPPVGG